MLPEYLPLPSRAKAFWPCCEVSVLSVMMATLPVGVPEPVTALFCWHDRMGYSALEACEALGIAVPERLSVIGYDGIHWPSTSRHILTSVEVPLDTIAVSAVQLLHELILGQAEAPVCRVLPVSLWQGTTLAPPFPGDVGSV